jgi:hypothetical protein
VQHTAAAVLRCIFPSAPLTPTQPTQPTPHTAPLTCPPPLPPLQGYNTEEINREKRKLTATILRRMEVEEWDKERMRHFYYGQYGLGSW